MAGVGQQCEAVGQPTADRLSHQDNCGGHQREEQAPALAGTVPAVAVIVGMDVHDSILLGRHRLLARREAREDLQEKVRGRGRGYALRVQGWRDLDKIKTNDVDRRKQSAQDLQKIPCRRPAGHGIARTWCCRGVENVDVDGEVRRPIADESHDPFNHVDGLGASPVRCCDHQPRLGDEVEFGPGERPEPHQRRALRRGESALPESGYGARVRFRVSVVVGEAVSMSVKHHERHVGVPTPYCFCKTDGHGVITTETEKNRGFAVQEFSGPLSDRVEHARRASFDITSIPNTEVQHRASGLVDCFFSAAPTADLRGTRCRSSGPRCRAVEWTAEHRDEATLFSFVLQSEPCTDFAHAPSLSSPSPGVKTRFDGPPRRRYAATMSKRDFLDTGFSTRAVHVGQDPDPETGAVIPPLHATSTFVQKEFGQPGKYIYSRSGNPTRSALEANLAALESAQHGIAFASGCAATDSIMRLLPPGSHVIAGTDLYGGTYRLFEQVLRDTGLNFEYVDTTQVDAISAAWRDETAMVYIETPTNPLMAMTDLRAVADLTRERDVRLVVDNTFMSPYLQRPLEHGADLVLHSTTKYINGHSDSIGGVVMTNDDDDAERLVFLAKSVGATLSPFEAWLIQRGVKTLAVRMDRSQDTTERIVDLLVEHPKVERVYYPGLESHPQHELAKRQMDGFGGMVAFEVADMDAVKRLLDSLTVFTLAESLGGVETLISNPASMTHASIPKEEREARGVRDGLIRISVGIEDADDLIADLSQGLERL